MRRAITSGIVLGDALFSYWPIFFLSLVTILEVFAKANSAQFPFRFESSEFLQRGFRNYRKSTLMRTRSSDVAYQTGIHDNPDKRKCLKELCHDIYLN